MSSDTVIRARRLALAVAALLACAVLAGLTVAAGPAPAQSPSACSDGVDNDGDGRVDFPADPGCGSENSDSEVDDADEDRVSACSDGVDNDGDGRVDFPADPECGSENSDSETDGAPAPPPAQNPGPGTTPPGPAPAPGATTGTGTSTAAGVAGMRLARRGCVRRRVVAVVRGERIARVAVAIDGRAVRRVAAVDDELVRVAAGTRRLSRGRHRLTVRVTFADGTAKILRLRFRRCR